MLVEIPDPEVIIGGVIAFLVGVFGLFLYYKIKPYVNLKPKTFDLSHMERLEYYERQLIDMKIRLDALEIQGIEEKSEDPNLELKQFFEKLVKNEAQEKQVEDVNHSQVIPEKLGVDNTNPTNYVLHLITNKAMTSRDIQITLKRSREHTSRLMKKLFEDGFVERNTETKPYTYSITKKGKTKVDQVQTSQIIA